MLIGRILGFAICMSMAALARSIVLSASVKFIILYPLDITAYNTTLVYSSQAVKADCVVTNQTFGLFTC